MRILHIAPNASFTSGLGYQENLLPKYQLRLGNDVTLIVRNVSRPDGFLQEVDCSDEICEEGFRVIRKRAMHFSSLRFEEFFSYIKVRKELREINPDIVFFHGFVSFSILDVVNYKKKSHPSLFIIQDNHEDYNIGLNPNDGLRQKLRCAVFKSLHRYTNKYIDRVYGVTPWRTEYAQKVYGVDPKKCDTLIMGADDELMKTEQKTNIRAEIRELYGINADSFLVVTGGKIDCNKRIIPLMRACSCIQRVQLVVFGTILDDVKNEFYEILNTASNILYVGWMDNTNIYKLFIGADLIVFPGQHSVLWEQACASKTPCLFGKWEGMGHVNNGGNSGFIDDYSPEGLKNSICSLLFTEKYEQMKSVAESDNTDIYLYSKIAQKTLDDYNKYSRRNN